jgi:nicotinate-nucleotide--dimethylbenzimidazole phosphoribosyltransferase
MTSAATLACALLAASSEPFDTHRTKHVTGANLQALGRHRRHLDKPLEALRRLGGFELAALTGSYMACAHMGLAVLVDGFVTTVAALTAERLCPGAKRWFLFSHSSAEPRHRFVLEAIGARPLLDLGMCSEDGCGAAGTVPLLRLACSLHGAMAAPA